MAKINLYLITLAVLLILFNAAGLIENTPIASLMDLVLDPTNIQDNNIYLIIVGMLGLLSTVGVVIGLLSPGRVDIIILAIIGLPLITVVVWDFIAIFGVVQNSIGWTFSILLFSPIIIGFIIESVSWVMGRS